MISDPRIYQILTSKEVFAFIKKLQNAVLVAEHVLCVTCFITQFPLPSSLLPILQTCLFSSKMQLASINSVTLVQDSLRMFSFGPFSL